MVQEKYEKAYGRERWSTLRKSLSVIEKETQKNDGETELHIAAKKQNAEAVEFLIREKSTYFVDVSNPLEMNPNVTNSNLDTPLHVAVTGNNPEIVTALISSGADVNAINRDGNVPLHKAAESGKDQNTAVLIKSGAEINAKNLNLETPLIVATKSGTKCNDRSTHFFKDKPAVVRTLLRSDKVDVNTTTKNGETALHFAAEKGDTEIIDALAETGNLEVNRRNKQDISTALQLAAENQHLDVVKRLINLGAEVNVQRADGWTPLYTAAYNGDEDVVEQLCKHKANVNVCNDVRWCACHLILQGRMDSTSCSVFTRAQ